MIDQKITSIQITGTLRQQKLKMRIHRKTSEQVVSLVIFFLKKIYIMAFYPVKFSALKWSNIPPIKYSKSKRNEQDQQS